jgi:hypothetical protein
MANDREVLKVLWEGKIPCKFVAEDESEDEFFLMLPRVSYLSLATDKVLFFKFTIYIAWHY